MSTLHLCWSQQSEDLTTILKDMLSASEYWQPDRVSSWVSTTHPVGLAKAQLFNTLRSEADGIHHDPALGLSIVANARIDNRPELASLLGLDADHPSIATDGQLLLQCYAKWGKGCAARLRGDFVFILFDAMQQKLFCARDHFGVKVLFYAKTERGVLLSNEHRAFFTSGWCDPQALDERWLVENLWGLNPLDFESPNPEIHVMPPAHTLEIDRHGTMTLEQYWYLTPKTDWDGWSDEALIHELRNRFQQSVVARLDSRYPLGVELSEGLDSNGIAGYAAEHLRPQIIHTFSYQCEALTDANRDVWAATYQDIEGMLALHENLEPVWQAITRDEIERELWRQKQAFFQSFGAVLPSVRDTMCGASLAHRKGIRVMLSGWGGDHCVSCPGDEYANELVSSGRIIAAYRLLKSKKRRGRCHKPLLSLMAILASKYVPSLSLRIKARRRGVVSSRMRQVQQHFLDPKWVNHFRLDHTFEATNRRYHRQTVKEHELRELFEIGLTNRLTNSELTARQNKLEYRFPMLDVDLVEFAHSLPSRLKIHQGIERYPFRRILEGVTTPRIQWRRKADVQHPKLDSLNCQGLVLEDVAKNLNVSRLIEYYCSKKGLNEHLHMNSRSLKRLEFMTDIAKNYFQ